MSWISSNSRTFSIAIAAWSAKVDTSSICLSVNGRTCKRVNVSTPIGLPSRNIGTPSKVRYRAKPLRLDKGVVRISEHIGNVHDFPFEQSTTVHRAALRLDWHIANQFDEFRREPVGLGAIKHAILLARDRRLVGVAKPRRRFDQRLQNTFSGRRSSG